jgi:hypothetical protein
MLFYFKDDQKQATYHKKHVWFLNQALAKMGRLLWDFNLPP